MGRWSFAAVRTALLVMIALAPSLAQVGPRRLLITATDTAVPLGQTQSLTVSASFFRGSRTTPFNGKIRWYSSDSTRATVAAGTVTANNSNNRGFVTITAVSGPAVGSITLAVVPSGQPLTGLTITPKSPSPVAKGLPQQFQATANYSGTLQDVTAAATWSSSDANKALMNSSGLARTTGVGSTTISASFSGMSDSTTLTVSPAVLQSIEVLPGNSTLPSYTSQQFTATGHWTDGTRPDTNVTWSSTNTSVATVDLSGLVSGFAPGSSNIVANDGSQGVSGQTGLNVVVTTGQAVRFLEQSSFGPTTDSIAQVQSMGFDAYINQQFSAPISTFPPPVCNPDCGDLSPVQATFFNNALYGPDQLRQRMAFALQQIFVVSGVKVGDSVAHTAWQNMMLNDAFGTYDQLDRDVTLSPVMGNYLDMVNNDAEDPSSGLAPNENYARELNQLFNVGVYKLNIDGTVQRDQQGKPIPSYGQDSIEAFAHVFTGWTYPLCNADTLTDDGHNYNECYIGQMFVPFLQPDVNHPADANHDKGAKTPLLGGATLPAGQTSAQDLNQALANIFNHPNVGPFVSKQLIKHLVKSNPSPAYVQRVATVFNNNGSNVRGDLKAVVKAILLDPEARQADVSTVDLNEGHLREPVLYMTSALRGLDATKTVTNTDCPTCSDLPGYGNDMGQEILFPPSVFNYFPINYEVPNATLAGSNGVPLIGPEFGLMTTTLAFSRANFINDMVYGSLQNTAIDFSPYVNLAGSSPDAMIEKLNQRFLHGQMPDNMRAVIKNAVLAYSSTSTTSRAKSAIYLVLTSSQYQVQH